MRCKELVIISRMKIGHTFLKSTLFILGKHQSGLCSYQETETVQHALIEIMPSKDKILSESFMKLVFKKYR